MSTTSSLLPSAPLQLISSFFGQILGHDNEKFVQLATTDPGGSPWLEVLEQGGLDEQEQEQQIPIGVSGNHLLGSPG